VFCYRPTGLPLGSMGLGLTALLFRPFIGTTRNCTIYVLLFYIFLESLEEDRLQEREGERVVPRWFHGSKKKGLMEKKKEMKSKNEK
jgi:hypothetical protein